MMRLHFFPVLALSLVAQTPDAKAPAAVKPQVEAKKENKVVAVVAGQVIRDSEVDAVIEAIPQIKEQLKANPAGRDTFIQNLAEVRLLAAKARKQGLDKVPGYKMKLQLQEDQLLRNEYLTMAREELNKKLAITDEELKAYFEKNKDKFKTPDKASARHILVKTVEEPVVPAKDAKPEDVAKAKDAAKAKAEEAAKAKIAKIQDLLKQGKKLEELAKEYSDDPGSKDKGGLYEDFDPSGMVPPFAEAVRKQELNKVGEPVKTDFGYHLIEVTKREAGTVPAFEVAKEQVRQAMTPERQEKVGKAFMEALKSELGFAVGADVAKVVEALSKTPAKKATKGAAK